MKSSNVIRAIVTTGLGIALLIGLASAAGADDGRIIAKCSLVETSIVKTAHYDVKARTLRWQVSKKAGKYPWVRAKLEENPAGDVIPETELAKSKTPPEKERAVLATMRFVEADERPFDRGKAALGEVALAVYPVVEKPVRYALVKKNGKVLITHKQTAQQPVHLTYHLER